MQQQTMQAPAIGNASRQAWLSVLTQQKEAILNYEHELRSMPFEVIRQPEVGMTMVKGKTAGEGQVFNLGEVTVTRCVVRIETGEVGFSYVVGRNKKQALLIALADAHLQNDENQHWHNMLLNPLAKLLEQRIEQQERDVMQTKVDFFTLVRGED